MGLRLIRQKSDTPNVQNTDDARMVRYAYGGYDGVVKNKGTECSYTTSGTTFKINSGVLVLQGWEIEIDGNGWEMSIDSLAKYYAVYLEVNLATNTAAIKSAYATGAVPSIESGDDLTTIINGTARMILYTFKTSGGIISEVEKKVSVIRYLKEIAEELGFKEASVENGEITIESDWADATIAEGYPSGRIVKQGKCAVIESLKVKSITVDHTSSYISISGVIARIPQYLCPKEIIVVKTGFSYYKYLLDSLFPASETMTLTINTQGEIRAEGYASSSTVIVVNKEHPVTISIEAIGWLLL